MAINDGLVGHWSATLDPGASAALSNDLAGSINGTGTNLQFVSDTDGNGTNAWENTANGFMAFSNIQQTADMSFCMWVKRPTGAGGVGQHVFFSAESSTTDRFRLDYGAGSNQIRWSVGDSLRQNSGFTATPDGWDFYVLTVDSILAVKFYGNATRFDFATAGFNPSLLPSTTWFLYSSGGDNARCLFDTVRQYNRVLSDAEVTELYNAGRGEAFTQPAQSYNELFGYGSHSVPSDLYLHYTMQETSGTNVVDRGLRSDDATNNGATVDQAGPNGYLPKSYAFDGAASHLLLDHALTRDVRDELSICLFQKNDDLTLLGALCGERGTGTSANGGYLFSVNGETGGDPLNLTAFGQWALASNASGITNDWHFASVSFGGGSCDFYFDGASIGSTAESRSATESIRPFAIGAWNNRGDIAGHFDGNLAGFAVFDRVLNADEHAQAASGPEPYFSSAPSAPTGTLETGKPMRASEDNVVDPNNGPLVFTHQWVRASDSSGTGETVITNATNSVYYPVDADLGFYLACVTTVANDGGTDPAEINTRSAYTSAPVTASTFSDGLASVWSATLNGPKSGTTVFDLATNDDDMTLIGGPTWVTDSTGNGTHAVKFVAGQESEATPTDTSYRYFEQPFTMSVWAKMESIANFGSIFALSATNESYAQFYVNNAVNFRANIRDSSNAFIDTASADTDWHHFVFVQESVSSRRFYLDKVEVGQDTTTLGAGSRVITKVHWGRFRQSSPPELDGLLDTSRLYQRALTPAEVAELFNAGRAEDFAPAPPADFKPHYAVKTTHVR